MKMQLGKIFGKHPAGFEANQPDSGVKDLKYEQTYCDELSSAGVLSDKLSLI